MFLVMLMKESVFADVNYCMEAEIKMEWAEGMIGAMPIFSTREAAEEYADGNEILEVEFGEDK